ncbi:MAG: hypothetical protein DMG36_10925 [Acidobacteria bacterium]|nr:MAG: hypothetical protein DMG36_10925 [Acidobacteriota bacterium]
MRTPTSEFTEGKDPNFEISYTHAAENVTRRAWILSRGAAAGIVLELGSAGLPIPGDQEVRNRTAFP